MTSPDTEKLDTPTDLAGSTVVVAGATGSAGRAVCTELLSAKAQVVALGSNLGRLQQLEADLPGLRTAEVDLADFHLVCELAASLGPVDGLIHLVGGWRGGQGLVDQSDADWTFLSTALITTLRNTSRAFHDQLIGSPNARLAIVSATGVDAPQAGSANYISAKAAAEAWVASVAQSFSVNAQQTAAAVTYVVKALVDDQQRATNPTRTFPGYTDVTELAAAIRRMWSSPAATLNGQRISLVNTAT